jgi:hypothetical protein
MSDSRIDYQPLHTEALDSLSYHLTNPPDTPGQEKSSTPRDRVDNDFDDEDYEEDSIHATEIQELVSSSNRESIDDHVRRPQELLGQDDAGEDGQGFHAKSAAAAADWAIRMQAFFCAAMLGVSTHFTLHMTGPLKDVLKEVTYWLRAKA